MIDIAYFLKNNHHKRMTVMVWLYAAFFRFCIRFIAAKKLRPYWGIPGEESADEASVEEYEYAREVGRQVARTAKKTPWESKCLVRALTAQKVLKQKDIGSTMYLGVKTENGKMVAHAWLRVGKMYVTGGDGAEYAVVDKYRV